MAIGKAEFLKRLNAHLGNNSAIIVKEHKDDCFFITVENPFIDSETLKPTEAFIDLIKKEGLACYGADISFNCSNSLFWVDHG
jgi:hypothetical protein